MTLKYDIDLDSAHHLTERNIWMKFDKNRLKGSV